MNRKVMKRGFLGVAACAIALLATTACSTTEDPGTVNESTVTTSSVNTEGTATGVKELPTINNGDDAMSVLESGNAMFLNGQYNGDITQATRENLAANGQTPHTVVITCSDSRVPPELIFDAGLGELFVIRTAGNVVGDYEVGSVEYAVDHLHAPLILVMGHSGCGAVDSAIQGGHAGGHVDDILEEIQPSVAQAQAQSQETEASAIADLAENLNVQNTVNNLMESDIISQAVQNGTLKIASGKYDISTGQITYFDTQTNPASGTTSSASGASSAQ